MVDWFHEDYDARGIFFCWENNMKNPDKNLSGKSDEREVKNCKRAIYKIKICESLGFVAPKVRFRRVKGDVWDDETWPLAQSKHTFRDVKPKL